MLFLSDEPECITKNVSFYTFLGFGDIRQTDALRGTTLANFIIVEDAIKRASDVYIRDNTTCCVNDDCPDYRVTIGIFVDTRYIMSSLHRNIPPVPYKLCSKTRK